MLSTCLSLCKKFLTFRKCVLHDVVGASGQIANGSTRHFVKGVHAATIVLVAELDRHIQCCKICHRGVAQLLVRNPRHVLTNLIDLARQSVSVAVHNLLQAQTNNLVEWFGLIMQLREYSTHSNMLVVVGQCDTVVHALRERIFFAGTQKLANVRERMLASAPETNETLHGRSHQALCVRVVVLWETGVEGVVQVSRCFWTSAVAAFSRESKMVPMEVYPRLETQQHNLRRKLLEASL